MFCTLALFLKENIWADWYIYSNRRYATWTTHGTSMLLKLYQEHVKFCGIRYDWYITAPSSSFVHIGRAPLKLNHCWVCDIILRWELGWHCRLLFITIATLQWTNKWLHISPFILSTSKCGLPYILCCFCRILINMLCSWPKSLRRRKLMLLPHSLLFKPSSMQKMIQKVGYSWSYSLKIWIFCNLCIL